MRNFATTGKETDAAKKKKLIEQMEGCSVYKQGLANGEQGVTAGTNVRTLAANFVLAATVSRAWWCPIWRWLLWQPVGRCLRELERPGLIPSAKRVRT
jgi:hypothetical protein